MNDIENFERSQKINVNVQNSVTQVLEIKPNNIYILLWPFKYAKCERSGKLLNSSFLFIAIHYH
jgi:hypothetical protein